MVSSFQLDHISFLRVRDLLSNDRKSGGTSDLSEAEYLADAPITREEFLSTNVGNHDAEAHMKSNEAVRHTYHAYMRSLMRSELEGQESEEGQTPGTTGRNEADQANLSREEAREQRLSGIAKRMMSNGAVRLH